MRSFFLSQLDAGQELARSKHGVKPKRRIELSCPRRTIVSSLFKVSKRKAITRMIYCCGFCVADLMTESLIDVIAAEAVDCSRCG
jgi:hypothetical protein